MKPRPQDLCPISKVASEEMVRLMADIHGFEYAIIVPHNIIGPRQRLADSFRNVAAIFINRMLQGKQPIIYGDGEQKRCFTLIQDDIRPLGKLVTYNNVTGEVIIVTIETIYTLIALQSCDQVCIDFQWLL